MAPYADIIIIALVAGFILLRLRSILGKDIGFDGKSDPQKPRDGDLPPADAKPDKSVSAGMLSFPDLVKPQLKQATEKPAAADKEAVDALPPFVKSGIENIKKADINFNLKHFVEGSKSAFEMVHRAFNANDKATLNMLMTPKLAEVFVHEAEQRSSGDTREESTLVRIASAEVQHAEIRNKVARIAVQFISEQISLVRDREGKIIEGNPSHAAQVKDEWVFERDTTSKNPNWMIVDT